MPTFITAVAYNEDYTSPRITSAASLPAGWKWVDWDDGSGHIESPTGKSYFSYDRTSYPGNAVEYKEVHSKSCLWGPFWGTLAEFKAFAETVVLEKGYR